MARVAMSALQIWRFRPHRTCLRRARVARSYE